MRFWWAGVFLVGALLHSPHSEAADSTPARPNILLVMVDALRADHLGCYGYERDTTPFIDQLAATGMRFAEATSSSSWTTPSVMTTMTSLLPRQHTVITTKRTLPPHITTLALELKKRGYHTVAVTVNPCASAKLGFGRGFDVFDDFTILLNVELNVFDALGTAEKKSIHRIPTSRKISDLALGYLRDAPAGKPWFLFLFYFDPHGDYTPPKRYAKMFDPDYRGPATGRVYGGPAAGYTYQYPSPADLNHVIALYDGEIRYTDDEFRRFFRKATDAGKVSDNTVTVITSDHGEEFNEHGGTKHGRTLFEEVVHVPLILHWPRRIAKASVSRRQVGLIDIMPTLLTAAGQPVPAACTGTDLLTLTSGNGTPEERTMHLHVKSVGEACAQRTATWKTILDIEADSLASYDLAQDPGEKHPLDAGGDGLALRKWNQAAEGQYARTAPASSEKAPTLSAAQVKALKSMGYVH